MCVFLCECVCGYNCVDVFFVVVVVVAAAVVVVYVCVCVFQVGGYSFDLFVLPLGHFVLTRARALVCMCFMI